MDPALSKMRTEWYKLKKQQPSNGSGELHDWAEGVTNLVEMILDKLVEIDKNKPKTDTKE